MTDDVLTTNWWARGLLFENCSCQLVCPGHLHFEQECTYDRCLGYWALRVDEGKFDTVSLDGVKAVVAFNSPKRMIDGGWKQRIIIDSAASPEQTTALETILLGNVGGPWAVLARFVGEHVGTKSLPIEIEENGHTKQLKIDGVVEAIIEPIRGRDKSKVVTFENIFNQIHASSQVIGRGDTTYDDGEIAMENKGSHGLYSYFMWKP